jgi:hypothetical protein
MDILMKNVMFPDNVDRSGKEMRVINFVWAVSADDENRLRFSICFDSRSDDNLQLVVCTPLKIILVSAG